MKLIPSVLHVLILMGCNSPEPVGPEEGPSPVSSFPSTLKETTAIERDMGSKDLSYEYTIEIDTSLYPNKPGFRLQEFKRFLRPTANDGMEYTLTYFATPDDSVRTILHEWNVAEEPGNPLIDSALPDTDAPQTKIIDAFDRKFAALDSTFTSLLGKPVAKDIKDNSFEEVERDEVKWQGSNQLNAYLLMFKRDKGTYRQIRLIVYPR